jgi:hypothetical protein
MKWLSKKTWKRPDQFLFVCGDVVGGGGGGGAFFCALHVVPKKCA